MQTFKKDSFVKFSDADNDGNFSIVGQVVGQMKTGELTIRHETGGTLTFASDDLLKIVETKKPANWSVTNPVKKEKRTTNSCIGRTGMNRAIDKAKRFAERTSKKDQVIELYKSMDNPTRKEAIETFVSELDMTPAGASTYYSMAKRQCENE